MGRQVSFEHEDRFVRVAVLVAIALLAVGGLFGVVQLVTRTPGMPKLVDAADYYTVLTGHGVVLAVAMTTFYIMGITAYLAPRVLGVNLDKRLLYSSLALSIVGTALAGATIVAGRARVLYTFYLPMIAHPAFYVGAALLIVGSWVFAASFFTAFMGWRRLNGGRAIPLPVFGLLATFIVWIEATVPLVVDVAKNHLPASLGLYEVDVLEARTLFWWFGHPLVYFWIIPAITLWYYVLPRVLGVPLFSERMAKAAFILFIMDSTPVGLHHQFLDPGIGRAAKLLHAALTFAVAMASLMTAFNVLATLERAGRLRGGGGLFGWVAKLPWRDPVFAGVILAFIAFGNGGITGIINASYQLNLVVHNTAFVPGHFHTMVGTAVTLTFMVATYMLLREVYAREIKWWRAGSLVPYLWFIGVTVFSISYYIAGIEGSPRRTFDVSYGGLAPESWPALLIAGAAGGLLMALGGALFLAQVAASLASPPRPGNPSSPTQPYLEVNEEPATILDRLGIWIAIAIILIVIGYSIPLYELYTRGLNPVPPIRV